MYKPQLLRLANIWANPRRRKRFDLIVLAMVGVICALTAGTLVFMGWIGIPVMGFMYGIDFEKFRALAYLMIAAGGVSAAIDFLYAIITVLRHQDSATKPLPRHVRLRARGAHRAHLAARPHGGRRWVPRLDALAAGAAGNRRVLPHSAEPLAKNRSPFRS